MEATYLKSRCFHRRHGSSALELPDIVPFPLIGVIRWDLLSCRFGTASRQSTKNVSRTYAPPENGASPSWSSTNVLKWYSFTSSYVQIRNSQAEAVTL